MRLVPRCSIAMLLAAGATLVGAAEPVPPAGATPPAPVGTVPFELVGDRIYVAARLDGQALKLLVDPGGINVLDPRAVARLGLRDDPALGREAGVPAARGGLLELGGFAWREPAFLAVPLGRLPEVEGIAFDGVLGHEAFARAVLTVDYAARRLTVADPAAPPPPGVRVPFRLADRLPLVEAAVDGRRGDFALDLGAKGPLLLEGPFVREHRLLEGYAHGHELVVGWGLAGPVRAFATRVGALEVGGIALGQLPALLRQPSRDAPAGRQLAGSIGGAALKRFTVVLDHFRRELSLTPNGGGAAPEPFDRSGMWINLDGEDLIIDALQPNGPGARSQLQAHDRIVSIDGRPATQLTLAEVRRVLAESPAGTRVKIAARRDGKVVHATVVLADLIPPPTDREEPHR